MYTFSFIVRDIIPKSVKCIHSATKYPVLARALPGGTEGASKVGSAGDLDEVLEAFGLVGVSGLGV